MHLDDVILWRHVLDSTSYGTNLAGGSNRDSLARAQWARCQLTRKPARVSRISSI
jgi:hypothetical protein